MHARVGFSLVGTRLHFSLLSVLLLFQSGTSSDAVAAFLKSGTASTPAYYTYTPIWTLLEKLSDASSADSTRVQLLNGYYETYLAQMSGDLDGCWISGVDYDKYDISNVAVDSAAECQSECAASTACNFWTRGADGNCHLKSSNDGFRLDAAAVSGSAHCDTKRGSGYEVLVSQTSSSITFDAVACEFPLASESECDACGNVWSSYTDADHDSCDWWSCDDRTLYFCSSPSMRMLPDDWIASGHTNYGDPDDGCRSDENSMSITDFAGTFCSPECVSDSCSSDVPSGVTAEATCSLTSSSDGTKLCALTCTSDSDCGNASCEYSNSSTAATSGYCMYT